MHYVYIASNAIILLGVTIGDNVIVAVGSVEQKLYPSVWLRSEVLQKIISSIEEYYKRNKNIT